jgi:tellurite resistance protein TehA-like permease
MSGRIGIAAVMLQGLGWVVALMMYSIYSQRLMTSKLPSAPTRPGMYVSVGPAGTWSLSSYSSLLITNTYQAIRPPASSPSQSKLRASSPATNLQRPTSQMASSSKSSASSPVSLSSCSPFGSSSSALWL